MFRTYQDTMRTPTTKQEKVQKLQVYSCDTCTEGSFFSEHDVEIHRRKKHFKEIINIKNQNPNSFCTVCMRLQESNEDLISHVKEIHLLSSPNAERVERKIFICDYCNNIFFNKDLLAAHIKVTHQKDNVNDTFTCPKCFINIRFKTIWFHYQKHELPNISVCDICLESFNSKEELFKHVKIHNYYFSCEQCAYHSTRKELFDAHMNVHDQRSYQITCTTVKNNMFNTFRSTHALKYNIHNTIKGLVLPQFMNVCVLCREICLNEEEVIAHILKDHVDVPKKTKVHVCFCGMQFEYQVMLKQHIHQMTEGTHRAIDSSEIPRMTVEDIKLFETSMFDSDMKNESEDAALYDVPLTAVDAADTDDAGFDVPLTADTDVV